MDADPSRDPHVGAALSVPVEWAQGAVGRAKAVRQESLDTGDGVHQRSGVS